MTPTIFIFLFMMIICVVGITLSIVDFKPGLLAFGVILFLMATCGFFVQEVRHEILVRKTAMYCMYHREEILKKSPSNLTNLDVECIRRHYKEYFNLEDKK